jgi:hypothetical protein
VVGFCALGRAAQLPVAGANEGSKAGMPTIDCLRTLSARPITRRLRRPRALVVRAWAWLAAQTNDLAEQVRCLEAIVGLGPSLDWAQAAVTGLWYLWRREN